MATKKLTSRTTPITPIKPTNNDKTKLLRWFIAGVAATLVVDWFHTGGFAYFTDTECIAILLIIGIAYGLWVEHWLQK